MDPNKALAFLCLAFMVPVMAAPSKKGAKDKDVMEEAEEDGKTKNLLSRLYGNRDFLEWRPNFKTYTCTTPAVLPTKKLPLMTLNGVASSITTVLVGYGPKETSDRMRGNKGYIYGVGVKRNFYRKLKNKFTFTIDYCPPTYTLWDKEEFCVLVFSPALELGPSIIATIGKKYDDPRRYFGSTENIVKTLVSESPSTNSKLLTQCCFIMTTDPSHKDG